MNTRMIARSLGLILLCLAVLLLLPLIAGLYYGESVLGFIVTIAISAAAAFVLTRFKPESTDISAREGFVIVGMGWILLSAIGALPFVISGDIPNYIDALFETASGLTTTGATIMTDIEAMSRGGMFWRMFTHWIGGMGVLVFIMAVMPDERRALDAPDARGGSGADGRQARPACAADGEDTLSHIFRADYHRGGAAPLRRHEQL